MAISKKTRLIVYGKYNGHCAYCGRYIEYKDMQVDHLKPLGAYNEENRGTDDIDNLMPACRKCNHYKRANTLEAFRKMIEEIPRKLHRNYIYEVGVIYGNVIEKVHPIKFYFEIFRETCGPNCPHWIREGDFYGTCELIGQDALLGMQCAHLNMKGEGIN